MIDRKVVTSLFVATYIITAPIFAVASTDIIENAGFIPQNIWFSKDNPKAGDSVKVYTVLWNGGDTTVSGEAKFYDNDKVIGTIPFNLPKGDTSKIISANWTVEAGYHKIYATIEGNRLSAKSKESSAISLEFTKTETSDKFVSAKDEVPNPVNVIADYSQEKAGFAQGYVKENLPKPIVDFVSNIASTTEDWRTDTKSTLDDKIASIKSSIDEGGKKSVSKIATKTSATSTTKSIKADESGNESGFTSVLTKKDLIPEGVQNPFKYVEMAALSLASFALGSKYLFYGLILLFAIFIIRILKNKFFSKSY